MGPGVAGSGEVGRARWAGQGAVGRGRAWWGRAWWGVVGSSVVESGVVGSGGVGRGGEWWGRAWWGRAWWGVVGSGVVGEWWGRAWWAQARWGRARRVAGGAAPISGGRMTHSIWRCLAAGCWAARRVGSPGRPSGGVAARGTCVANRSIGKGDGEFAVGAEGDGPVVVMDVRVVSGADGEQVVEVGVAAVAPPGEVVQFAAVVLHGATGDRAAGVEAA